MADKRKLQGDIDRCLKKVAEGVEQFEDIWKKVHTASNANQKEKYEADLKKEIKKLQRLRDQIKTWLQSNDIKDKAPLMENRRLIETQMERFKVVERETKTKAYSKEGLGLATKIDPAQKEKEEVRLWLVECIDKLNLQIDQFESEAETLRAGLKKKKADKDKSERVQELQEWVDKHKFHIQKAETMMRMLDNCTLDTSQVKLLQDDLNYYVDNNQDMDFNENEMMYDDIDLEEVQSTVFTTAVPGGSAPHQVNDVLAATDETQNSIPGSPGSTQNPGPLSPRTPTAMRSTSQELFDERRRGKTSVSSASEVTNEVRTNELPPVVPPSPGKLPKSLTQNSSSSRTGGISLNKMTTPTSGKSNSLGGSTRSRNNSTSSMTTISSGQIQTTNSSSASKPNQRNLAKPTQLPHGHGYAVAAGGAHQQVNSHSQVSQQQPTTPNTPLPSMGLSNAIPITPAAGGAVSYSTSTSSNLCNSLDDGSGVKEVNQPQDVLVSALQQASQQMTSQGNPQMTIPLSGGQSTGNTNFTNNMVLAQHISQQAHQGSHPGSLIQTSSTSQPRPMGPGSLPSQPSEHSRTNSTSSSFSPSTLSQDSQPTILTLSQPTPVVYSQSSNGPGSGGSGSDPNGTVPPASGSSVHPIQTSAPISASGPPSVDTTHLSPSSNEQSSALSPSVTVASSGANTLASSYHPHQVTFHQQPLPPQQQQQQQQQQTISQTVPTTSLPASSLPIHHNQPEGSDSSSLMPAPSLPGNTAAMQGDFGSNLPSWIPGVSVSSGSGHGGMLMGAIGVSPISTESESLVGMERGGFLPPGSGQALPTTSNSPLLSAVIPNHQQQQQKPLGHSSYASSVPPPPHLPTPSSTSSTVASTAIGTTLLQTTTAPPFVSSESSAAANTSEAPTSLKAMAAQVVANTSGSGPTPHPPPSRNETFKGESSEITMNLGPPGSRIGGGEVTTTTRTDAQLPPLLGVTPLGPVSLSQEKIYQLKMLEVAYRHLPQPSDSEKVRPYIQRSPCPTPFYHHQHPPPHFDSFEFFQRLSIETLFFVFYYMEGTKAQYMAAKALKKLSWRFHTKYMMWFQRLEEPKAITDDYEMGTYIYFDFEKWSQRKKEGFTFEYRYLEDKDLP